MSFTNLQQEKAVFEAEVFSVVQCCPSVGVLAYCAVPSWLPSQSHPLPCSCPVGSALEH